LGALDLGRRAMPGTVPPGLVGSACPCLGVEVSVGRLPRCSQTYEQLYRALGGTRGEAEALFWIGCLHPFIRRDNETAVPYLERSCRLAAQTGNKPTRSEALRQLGIAAYAGGRLDEARERLRSRPGCAGKSGPCRAWPPT
jgi:hypothetical protein